MTQILTEPTEALADQGPLLAHIAFNHSPQIALCGKRILGVEAPDDADVCVVCLDLEAILKRELGL